MKKIGIDFHSKRVELITFIYDFSIEFNLTIFAGKLCPSFSVREIADKELLLQDSSIEFVTIMQDNHFTDLTDSKVFLREQMGGLYVLLGTDDGAVLQESSMSAVSDADINPLWKKCISRWKKPLLHGAWVINPIAKTKAFYKNHCYTTCAREAYLRGVKIIPIAGNCIYQLSSDYTQ